MDWASLSAEQLRQSFHETGVLVCLDAPQGLTFGCDLKSWVIGPKFQGIKLLPPGIRFVHYSVNPATDGLGVQHGFFLDVKPNHVYAKRWDPKEEDFVDIADIEPIRRRVWAFELDAHLAPYDIQSYSAWTQLTRHLTPQTFTRLMVSLGAILVGNSGHETPYIRGEETRLVPKVGNHTTRTLQFSVVPNLRDLRQAMKQRAKATDGEQAKSSLQNADWEARVIKLFGSRLTPATITSMQMDRSSLLEHVLESQFQGCEAAWWGEFEMAFVNFIYLSSFDGLEHWKRSIDMLCHCDPVVAARTDFFVAFCDILQAQLAYIPEEFFLEDLTSNNFLAPCLERFFDTTVTSTKLSTRMAKLRTFASDRFGYKFQVEEEDCASYLVEGAEGVLKSATPEEIEHLQVELGGVDLCRCSGV